MKKNLYSLILLSLFSCHFMKAQVGVNTQNPQGIFHIDVRGNNPVAGIPSIPDMSDDVVVDKNSRSGINVSIGGKISNTSSAQLALLDPNKAILLNRVALTGLRDIVTIPDPVSGTLVYNTSTDGIYPDNIVPGYYYFDGMVWHRWMYGEVGSELSQHDLLEDCLSVSVPSLNSSGAATSAQLMSFGTIQMQDKGTYVFSLRLYGVGTAGGAISIPSLFDRGVIYLYVLKNRSTLIQSMELNVPFSGGNSAHTATVTLQALLEKDDVVTFRLAHPAGRYGWQLKYNGGGLRANKTSLIYWKI